ncbi:MAG: LysR family transcriptional regulator [Clostridia bacterium]|nr:LysR family transcriptional regulator [Clostridia bacterium]
MEILQLKYFCNAAKTQNFSHTAKEFNVPPSNISQCIKRLENELGRQLFDRKCNKISLNENGKMFYDKVHQALMLLDSATHEIINPSKKTINLCVLTNRQFVMNVTEKFLSEFPDVSVIISHDYNKDDFYDIIVADETFNEDNMIKKLVITENIQLAVNKLNPTSNKSLLTKDDLAKENYVGLDSSSSLYHTSKKIANNLGFEPNYVIQSPDPFYVRKCVELNLGVAFVPTISWKGMFSENIVLKDIGDYKRKTYALINKHIKKEWTQKLLDFMYL